ncbi:MAG: glycosyltransferase [Bacteroidetes bacterium]|nr:glycosyltransferase [Bacteroidota bacterium]
MPKILRIINRFNLGGPVLNAALLTKHLQTDFETRLVGGLHEPGEESASFIFNEMNIPFEVIPGMRRNLNPLNDYFSLLKIRKIIREFKPDIVHTHAAKAGTLGRLAARMEGINTIVHTFHGHVFHSYFNKSITGLFIGIERLLSRISSRIIAISAKQAEELTSRYRICSAEKITVIPLGFDLGKFTNNMAEKRIAFRNRFKTDDKTVAIGIIGRMVPVKNHRMFIEVFRLVRERVTVPVRAFIIGDGPMRDEIIQLAQHSGLSVGCPDESPDGKDIIFTSWIKEMDEVMAGLDIVSMTSLNEGTPVSIIEAQAAGKAVVAVKAGGTGDIVDPGVTALLAPPGDISVFTSNLESLVMNVELRIKMGKSGRDFSTGRFHYNRMVRETGDLYFSLIR